MNVLIIFLDVIGTIAFAISGAMIGMKKHMDVLGVSILGVTTAVGGGIIRDIIIGLTPPSAFRDPRDTILALIVMLIMLQKQCRQFFLKKPDRFKWLLIVMDAIGLGAFTTIGIQVAAEYVGQHNAFLLIFVGVVTGVGGGVLRDLFADRIPSIFVKQVYASASLLGAIVCVLLWDSAGNWVAMLAGTVTVVLLRLCSAYFQWNLPQAI